MGTVYYNDTIHTGFLAIAMLLAIPEKRQIFAKEWVGMPFLSKAFLASLRASLMLRQCERTLSACLQLFTAREGNVSRNVCQLFCSRGEEGYDVTSCLVPYSFGGVSFCYWSSGINDLLLLDSVKYAAVGTHPNPTGMHSSLICNQSLQKITTTMSIFFFKLNIFHNKTYF